MLLPTDTTSLRRSFDQWCESHDTRPLVVGEFEDSALLTVFGQSGAGLFPAPSAIEAEVRQQYGVQTVGRLDDIRERFYAISVERKLKHPAVVAISEAAQQHLFTQAN
jgi:LysR family transcriptional activator of nhaA